MIREVIITLAGFESELLTNMDKYVDLKDFLHPSEQIILRNILDFAQNYQFLKNFVDANLNAINGNKKVDLRAPSGLYVQAFCGGLEASLETYREEITSLEKNVLSSPSINLTYIYSFIHKYVSVFVLLKSLVNQILSQKVHGCQILHLLHENNLHAVDDAKVYLKCILKRCYVVFLRQTMSWLINGEPSDPFCEYLIQKNVEKVEATDESDTSIITLREDLVDRTTSEHEYRIAISYVPVFVKYSLANDILFVGQIVKILKENPCNVDFGDLKESIIFVDKHKYFFEQFVLLKSQEHIDLKKLENLVREIRTCVVEHLWSVAVENENLYEELQLLKNVYLLGFGQFFSEFLEEASVFSLHSSRSHISQISAAFAGLNKVMSDIASMHLHIDEKVLNVFSFKTLSFENKSAPESTDIIWSSIKLQYTPKWPLNLIFTPVAIEHYNKLFLFLLRVKRCHIQIHKVWKTDIKNKNRRFGKALKLRNELMFLINNLQFYLQVDVIETEYNNLIRECRKIKDFKQIEKLHNMFLLNVLSHSFLLDIPMGDLNSESPASATYSKHFYDVLLKNIRICEMFCLLASKDGFEDREEEINKLDRSFQKYKYIFMCFLAEYQSQPFKQHAAKLLLRLDFNNWVHSSIVDVDLGRSNVK